MALVTRRMVLSCYVVLGLDRQRMAKFKDASCAECRFYSCNDNDHEAGCIDLIQTCFGELTVGPFQNQFCVIRYSF